MSLLLLLAGVVVLQGVARGGQTMVDELPVVHGAADVPETELAKEKGALREFVEGFVRDGARVEGTRFFLVPSNTPWVAVESELGSAIEAGGTMQRQRFDWHRPGYELVDVWQGDGRRIAVAMTYDALPDGRRLLGYFELDR
ncbi:MAG TPA: hypothetical protein VFF71_08765 [Luteimonas sp.]|nr:hypothetical protein [Luteimonas sp.]